MYSKSGHGSLKMSSYAGWNVGTQRLDKKPELFGRIINSVII